jgi:glucose-6-phosphate 1-dehydrogenase
MKAQKKLPPAIMIIFGGSGDLTSRKLMPALFNLFIDDYLPGEFAVAGIGRTDYGGEEKYREHLLQGIKEFSRVRMAMVTGRNFQKKSFTCAWM